MRSRLFEMMIGSLYQVAQEADALVFSPGQVGQRMQAGMEEMIEFRRDQTNLRDLLGTSSDCGILEAAGLAPQVMHGKQSQIQLEAPSHSIRGCRKRSPSHALPFADEVKTCQRILQQKATSPDDG